MTPRSTGGAYPETRPTALFPVTNPFLSSEKDFTIEWTPLNGSMTKKEYYEAIDFACSIDHDRIMRLLTSGVLAFDNLPRGGIIGSVNLVDCVQRSDSPWFQAPYGFILRDPNPLPFAPFRGQLGFFDVPGVQP